MKTRVGAFLVSLMVFLILAGGVHFIIAVERDRREEALRIDVSNAATDHLVRLEAEINANVFLINGLMAYVLAVREIDDQEIQVALEALYGLGRHMRNVGIAPDNRITHVYPREGNEAAIGLDYRDLPDQWPAVEAAVECHCTILAGPVALRQGGIGLISRTPVFFPDGRYWGVLSLVLDFESLLESVGLAPVVRGVEFALRGRDARGVDGDVFFGDAAAFAADSIQRELTVPGGSWLMAARPQAGWHQGRGALAVIEVVVLLACALLATLLWAYLQTRLQVEVSERRLRAILSTTRDGVIVLDEHGIIHEYNPAAETMFGFPATEMIGTSVNLLMPVGMRGAHSRYLRESSLTDDQSTLMGGREVSGKHCDGSEFPIEITVGQTLVAGRRLFVGVVRDISERKRIERQLVELATTDGLTGALNRRAFLDEAERCFRASQRYKHPLSLLLIDADHFKRINDTYGHHVGDDVLKALVTIAQATLRQSDRFARFGGEEFIVLLPETDEATALLVAERLMAVVREARVEIDPDTSVCFTVSIGLAGATSETSTLDEIVRRADVALYRAKSTGRNRVCV